MSYPAYVPDDIDIRIAELLMATTDDAEPLRHPKVQEALRILRDRLDMEVLFVSQFEQGRRTFRVVVSSPQHTAVKAGLSHPVEESWCLHVVDGRLPQLVPNAMLYVKAGTVPPLDMQIGTHISTPVVLRSGSVYGTLCCFTSKVKEDVTLMDLHRLQLTAQLLAEDLRLDRTGKYLP